MTTVTGFIRQQLASTGWAPIHFDAAQLLCPEVAREHVAFAASQRAPESLPQAFPGAALYRAQVQGIGEIMVLSRSPQFLAERMGWLGLPAVSVAEILPARVKYAASAPTGHDFRAALKAKADERLERLRALADADIPAHDCARRREILAARAELEQLTPA